MDNFFRLYHGTDARFISLPTIERRAYLEDCKKVIDHLWSVLKEYYETKEMIVSTVNGRTVHVQQSQIEKFRSDIIAHCGESSWYHLYWELSLLSEAQRGEQRYEYGNLCLTGDKEKAKRYAMESFAGGRIGLMAYRLIQGAESLEGLGMKVNEEVKNAMERIKLFAEGEAIPVVVSLSNIDLDCLIFENSCSLEGHAFRSVLKYSNFIYTKDCILHLEDAEIIDRGQSL